MWVLCWLWRTTMLLKSSTQQWRWQQWWQQHPQWQWQHNKTKTMVLGKWTTWRPILLYAFIFIFYSLHVSSTSCSKHVENKNKDKYIEKNYASRWSFTKNHYMMHGQQNKKKKKQLPVPCVLPQNAEGHLHFTIGWYSCRFLHHMAVK